jgi:hypothetical protein
MKIAICTPVHGDTKAAYTASLVEMLIFTLGRANPPTISYFQRSSSMLPVGRCDLVDAALRDGADYILWVDSDHSFPPDTLIRLLAHNVDVVALNFRRRLPPHDVVAYDLEGRAMVSGTGLVKASNVGLGLCLMRTSVFKDITPPLFEFRIDRHGMITGEDAVLFGKILQAGFDIHVDMTLSAQCGHIAEKTLTLDCA